MGAPGRIVLLLAFAGLAAIAPAASLGVAAALFLAGIPHGGVAYRDRLEAPGLAFTLIYIAGAAIVFSAWWVAPVPTVAAFLALSAWHFSRAEGALRSAGAAVVLGGLLLRPDTTLACFALLAGQGAVEFGDATLALARVAGAAAFAWLGIESVRGPASRARAAWLALVIIALPPVEAVAVYFLFFHALPEYRRGIAQEGPARAVSLYARAGVPAVAGAIALGLGVVTGAVPIGIAGGLAVAVVVPHILDELAGDSPRLPHAFARRASL